MQTVYFDLRILAIATFAVALQNPGLAIAAIEFDAIEYEAISLAQDEADEQSSEEAEAAALGATRLRFTATPTLVSPAAPAFFELFPQTVLRPSRVLPGHEDYMPWLMLFGGVQLNTAPVAIEAEAEAQSPATGGGTSPADSHCPPSEDTAGDESPSSPPSSVPEPAAAIVWSILLAFILPIARKRALPRMR